MHYFLNNYFVLNIIISMSFKLPILLDTNDFTIIMYYFLLFYLISIYFVHVIIFVIANSNKLNISYYFSYLFIFIILVIF